MSSKVAYEFDPFDETGIDVPRDKRKEALEEVRNYVKEQTLSFIGEGKSPVAGGKWTRGLTKPYRKIKGRKSGAGFSNLELSGDMLDALDVKKKDSTTLSLQVSGSQAGKAEGNNEGTYGRQESTGRMREFIPKEGQTFRPGIWKGIKNILKDFE